MADTEKTLAQLKTSLTELDTLLGKSEVKSAIEAVPDSLMNPVLAGLKTVLNVIKDALGEIEKNLDKLTGLDQLLKAVNDLLTAAEGLAPGQKETLKNVKDIVNTLQDLPSAADILAIVNLIKGIITKLEAL
jgi:uncharacterized phage infection (PIP) family protein YhgE